jgi:DNA-binding MarR family transcriptional regulator
MLPTQCTCNKVRRAARVLSRLYDEALAPAGLRVTQFSLLRAAQRLGEVCISELAAATGHERSTLTRTLRVLQQEGLVRLVGGDDQRTRRVALTERGRAAIERALPYWDGAQARIGRELGADRRSALFALLDDVERLADGAPARSPLDLGSNR